MDKKEGVEGHKELVDSMEHRFYINSNHTYANSSVGIDTSDCFCKEDSVRKIENFEGVRGTLRV